jgi:hypothetical protein
MPQLLTVTGDGLTARVDASRGAKIVSLEDATGHEWLSPPPPLAAYSGRSFTDAEMCGWDECAPTISACRLDDGTELPDHGDLWDTEWQLDGDRLTARGHSMDYSISRGIHSIAGGLRLDYSVTAGARPTPFLWAAHPQFLAPAGSSVEVNATRVVDVMAEEQPELDLTPELATIDTVEQGGCRKLYVAPTQRVASAALAVPGHGRLELNWNVEVAPYLGLWFDNRRYSRVPVIAIEPATGYFDSLATALENDRALTLQPHATISWFVEVRVA